MSEHTAPLPVAPRTPVAGKLLGALVVGLLLVAGVFSFGRLADDADVAMGLTTAWFGAVFAGGYIFTRARRDLRLPLAAGFGVVAIATGLLIGLPSIRDKKVDEKVVVAAPAPVPKAESGAKAPEPAPTSNVQVAAGAFGSIQHSGRGNAAVVELVEGGRRLTLTDFATDSGPDLRVYLSTGDPANGDLGDHKDLGGLKGNQGNQQYTVPEDVNLNRYSTVVIWCRAFSVPFTSAPLKQS